MTQNEFEAILSDETKEISENITWSDDEDHSPAQVFRAEVKSDAGYPMFVQGRYNPMAGKLSYAVIFRGVGRIYGLDIVALTIAIPTAPSLATNTRTTGRKAIATSGHMYLGTSPNLGTVR